MDGKSCVYLRITLTHSFQEGLISCMELQEVFFYAGHRPANVAAYPALDEGVFRTAPATSGLLITQGIQTLTHNFAFLKMLSQILTRFAMLC